MYCSKCGKQIPNESKFCTYCGAPSGESNVDSKQDGIRDINQTVTSYLSAISNKRGKYTVPLLIICVAMLMVSLILPHIGLSTQNGRSYSIYIFGDNSWPGGISENDSLEFVNRLYFFGVLIMMLATGFFVIQDRKKACLITAIVTLCWWFISFATCMGLEDEYSWLSVVPLGCSIHCIGAVALVILNLRDYRDHKQANKDC